MSNHHSKLTAAYALLSLTLLAACSAQGSIGLSSNPPAQVTSQNTSLNACTQQIAEVKFDALGRSAQFKTEIISPGAFKHRYKVIRIDTTSLSAGGTLKVSGQLGTSAQGSFALLGSSPGYPCTGLGETPLVSSTNLEPGRSFEWSQRFSSGQVFHLLAEGSWHNPENTVNTANLTIRVE